MRLPASSTYRGADLAVEPGRALIVRQRVEGRLHMLQDGNPSRALYRIIGRVRAEGQLAQRHCRDQDSVGQFRRVEEPERGDDAGVYDSGRTTPYHTRRVATDSMADCW